MRGVYTRGQQHPLQSAHNKEKREKSQALIGKRLIERGVIGRVTGVDYKTGEALVRFKGSNIDKPYHPDKVSELLIRREVANSTLVEEALKNGKW